MVIPKYMDIISILKRPNEGSQDKWKIDGIWYKQDSDYCGNEGLAEAISSAILRKSNFDRFIDCSAEMIIRNGQEYTGCSSPDFLKKGEKLLNSAKCLYLAKSTFVNDFDEIYSHTQLHENIKKYVDEMQKHTGLNHFGEYLTKMLEFDKLTLNTDRHFSNISVLTIGKRFDYAPIFDNGRSFGLRREHFKLYKSGESIENIVSQSDARPFSSIYKKQAEAARELYSPQFSTSFSKEDLKQTLDECSEVYPDDILKYAEEIVLYQMQQNREFFVGKESEKWKDKISAIAEEYGEYSLEDIKDGLLLSSSIDQGASVFIPYSGEATVLDKSNRPIDWSDLVLKHINLLPLYREVCSVEKKPDISQEKNIDR